MICKLFKDMHNKNYKDIYITLFALRFPKFIFLMHKNLLSLSNLLNFKLNDLFLQYNFNHLILTQAIYL